MKQIRLLVVGLFVIRMLGCWVVVGFWAVGLLGCGVVGLLGCLLLCVAC